MKLVRQTEALLFASGKKMSVEDLAGLTNASPGQIKKVLKELQTHYKESENSLLIIDEGEHWKITVKEEYMPLVRQIVAETDLPKAILETLAVIAWKSPILQSNIIKIRNNKAYEHIAELVEAGFIVKERHGRSYKLRLTQKFSEYFDVDDIKRLRRQMEPKNVPDLLTETKD